MFGFKNMILFFYLCPLVWGLGQNSINPSPLPLSTYVYPDIFQIDSSLKTSCPFVDLRKNNFKFYSTKSDQWKLLYEKIERMVTDKTGKLTFYHIGGSHLQADIYTHDFRTFLQSHWDELPGERGLVFPFELANTNNPANYDFSSPNH